MRDVVDEPGTASVVEARWPLVKVFDLVAVVVSTAVVARAIGGVVSALGVPTLHVDLGATSESGVSLIQPDLGIPTFIRLEYGTSWADLVSGVLILAAVALVALPRMIWAIPPSEQWVSAARWLAVGILVVAVVAAVAGVVNIVDLLWHSNEFGPSDEALSVAQGVAAVAITGLGSVLSWFALPFVQATSQPGQPLADEGPPETRSYFGDIS